MKPQPDPYPEAEAMRALTALGAMKVSTIAVVATSMAVLIATIVVAGRMAASDGPAMAVLVVGVVCVAALLLVVPLEWLPATAVVAFAVVPNTMVPNEGALRAVPVMALIMVVWVGRRLLLAPATSAHPRFEPRPLVLLGYLFSLGSITWSLATALRSPSKEDTFGWVLSIVLGAFVVMLVPLARREAHLLKSAWVFMGFVYGLYAVVEVTLQRSPLLDALYDAVGFTPDRFFGVGTTAFRADAGFGHPLWAGSFFAVAAVLGIVGWVQGGRKRGLVFGVGAAAGAVATLSRGPISSIAIGVALGVVLVVLIGIRRPWLRLVGALVGAGFAVSAVLSFGPLVERLNSAGAAVSTDIRTTAVDVAIQSANANYWLGTGAGTSGITGREYTTSTIESSLAQLVISLGAPGLVLFALIVVVLVLNALQSRDIASGMALLAYVIAISTFNSIEGVRSMHLVLGLLFLLCISPTPPLARKVREEPAFERIPLLTPAGVSPLLGVPFDKLRGR